MSIYLRTTYFCRLSQVKNLMRTEAQQACASQINFDFSESLQEALMHLLNVVGVHFQTLGDAKRIASIVFRISEKAYMRFVRVHMFPTSAKAWVEKIINYRREMLVSEKIAKTSSVDATNRIMTRASCRSPLELEWRYVYLCHNNFYNLEIFAGNENTLLSYTCLTDVNVTPFTYVLQCFKIIQYAAKSSSTWRRGRDTVLLNMMWIMCQVSKWS